MWRQLVVHVACWALAATKVLLQFHFPSTDTRSVWFAPILQLIRHAAPSHQQCFVKSAVPILANEGQAVIHSFTFRSLM